MDLPVRSILCNDIRWKHCYAVAEEGAKDEHTKHVRNARQSLENLSNFHLIELHPVSIDGRRFTLTILLDLKGKPTAFLRSFLCNIVGYEAQLLAAGMTTTQLETDLETLASSLCKKTKAIFDGVGGRIRAFAASFDERTDVPPSTTSPASTGYGHKGEDDGVAVDGFLNDALTTYIIYGPNSTIASAQYPSNDFASKVMDSLPPDGFLRKLDVCTERGTYRIIENLDIVKDAFDLKAYLLNTDSHKNGHGERDMLPYLSCGGLERDPSPYLSHAGLDKWSFVSKEGLVISTHLSRRLRLPPLVSRLGLACAMSLPLVLAYEAPHWLVHAASGTMAGAAVSVAALAGGDHQPYYISSCVVWGIAAVVVLGLELLQLQDWEQHRDRRYVDGLWLLPVLVFIVALPLVESLAKVFGPTTANNLETWGAVGIALSILFVPRVIRRLGTRAVVGAVLPL